MRLEEAVQNALSRLQLKGIDGWGLFARDAELIELGEFVQVGSSRGCFDDRCLHNSHDPAAPVLRWVPRTGTLYHLGWDGPNDYFVLRLPNGRDLFIRRREERFLHVRLDVIDPAQIPECLLARLASE